MLPIVLSEIAPAHVYLDLPTRVAAVEFEFFKATGNWGYQLELCQRLHSKCVRAVLHYDDDGRFDDAVDLVRRMDAMILKGIRAGVLEE